MTNLYCSYHNDDLESSNYVWYFDKNKVDKIGIASNATHLVHDQILFRLKKYKIIQENINGVDTIQLLYKLDNNPENNSNQPNPVFTDKLLNSRAVYIIFKYLKIDNKTTFTHIIFNGKQFK